MTEFPDVVADRFSPDMVEDMIDDAQLPSGSAYTAVGTYPNEEMVAMLVALSQHSGVAVPALLKVFGEHLFVRFVHAYPSFFIPDVGALEFFAGI